MNDKKFSDVITVLRKEKGLTQQGLADKLNITDKAVSKWERGLSYPDITSISSLAKVLDVDSSYLIDLCKKEDNINPYSKNNKQIMILIFNAVAVAMAVAVIVLGIIGKLETKEALMMLGIGLFCISLMSLSKLSNDKENK